MIYQVARLERKMQEIVFKGRDNHKASKTIRNQANSTKNKMLAPVN